MTPTSAQDLAQGVSHAFKQTFGTAPHCLARAPGRVNLIGEHTDYNQGFVMPCAIDLQTVVAISARTDKQVRVLFCDQADQVDQFSLDEQVLPRPDSPWTHYVRGVIASLQTQGFVLRGADLAVGGNVPQGAGLSSSASLAVAVGQAFKLSQGLDAVGPRELALASQEAEHLFARCQCGVMDAMVSVRGIAGHALQIDCRTLTSTAIALPHDLLVLVVDSGERRSLASSQYNMRRQQCQAVADHFGVPALRDLDLAQLEDGASGIERKAYERARHVITENQRTLAAAQALGDNDLVRLGELMAESHASMRDDFEVSTPNIDQLVALVKAAMGPVGGVRMTGGGFGGCVVALLPESRMASVRETLARHYRTPDGHAAFVHVCRATGGASHFQPAQAQ